MMEWRVCLLGVVFLWSCGGAAPVRPSKHAPPPRSPHPESPAETTREAVDTSIAEEEDGGFEGDFVESYDEVRERVDTLVHTIEQAQQKPDRPSGPDGVSPSHCEEICSLREAICSSSNKICGISEDYPRDSYFLDRCRWASNACQEANSRCSVCEN